MESALGQDFSQVRVHSDPAAAESALAVRANAYALGSDIVFGGGKYAPGTLEGDRLVAHELTHVAQQGGRAPVRPSSLRLGEPSDHAEREAQQAAGHLAVGRRPALLPTASGIQRDELTEEEQRQLAAAPSCPSGRCHDPVPPSASGSFATSPADMAALRQWVEGQNRPVQQDEPAPEGAGAAGAAAQPLPVMKPPADLKAPPSIAHLGSRRKVIHVVEVFVPETRFASPGGPWGSNRVLSQADVVAQYDVEINQPDPTAGFNFDTYLWNVTSKRRIPAQWLGGTRFRVFMGTSECPGCHFGHGLEIELKGESFAMVMAQGLMDAAALSGLAGMGAALAEADEAALAAQPRAARTPDHEYHGGQVSAVTPGGAISRIRAKLADRIDAISHHPGAEAMMDRLDSIDPADLASANPQTKLNATTRLASLERDVSIAEEAPRPGTSREAETNEPDPSEPGRIRELESREPPEWTKKAENRRLGNEFNEAMRGKYQAREVRLKNGTIVDGYTRDKVIVSRKRTQLSKLSTEWAEEYINEFLDKYGPGNEIADTPANRASGLAKERLRGKLILEVPVQQEPVPAELGEWARRWGIEIRDDRGDVYN